MQLKIFWCLSECYEICYAHRCTAITFIAICVIMRHYTEFGLIDATGRVFVSEMIIYISQRYMMRQKYLYSGYSAI